MAPLSQALDQTQLAEERPDGTKVYKIEKLDKEWRLISVPYGGYTVGLILNAAIQSQKDTATPDPYFANFFFLRPLVLSSIEIHVKEIRRGGGTVNLIVNVYQESKHRTTGNIIFGNFEKQAGPSVPASHSALCPFTQHPATGPLTRKHEFFNFKHYFDGVVDYDALKRNEAMPTKGRTAEGLAWGAWLEFKEPKGTSVCADMIPAYIDLHVPVLSTLDTDIKFFYEHWYATLSMSIEFKTKFPLDTKSNAFDGFTLGHWAKERHLKDGRHSEVVELWAAPSALNVGGEIDPNWRDKMICVAVGSVMGLAVPINVNMGAAKGKSKRIPKAKL